MQTATETIDRDLAALEAAQSRLAANDERLAYAVEAEHSKLLRTRDGLQTLLDSIPEQDWLGFESQCRAAGIRPNADGALPISGLLRITRRSHQQIQDISLVSPADRAVWYYLDTIAEDLAHERCGVAPRQVSKIARQWLADRAEREANKGRATA